MRFKFSLAQRGDLLFVVFSVLLVAAGTVWFVLRFADPAPPKTFTIAAARAGSPYHRYAETYQAIFKRNGFKLNVRESEGSFANLKLMTDATSGVQAGIVQGGLASTEDAPGLLSVGRIAYEPLWVFYADGTRLDRLTDLKGKRILVGPAGSGTSGLAMRLLAANGITAETATLINGELPDYVDMLSSGKADAGFLVLAAEATTIQKLLRSAKVHLMNFANAEAYTQRFPFLSHLLLRQGVVDFAANIPPADVNLVATTTAVLVHEDTHPALVNLLTQALLQAHRQPVIDAAGNSPLFQRVGEFPIASDPEFPLSDEARRVYRSGPPFLQRYLPFWVATMVDRLSLSFVVLLPILLPLLRFAPQLYRWRIRTRITRWYGQLRRLESAARNARTPEAQAANRAELERIENAVENIPVPLGFADQLYELRQHVEAVRRHLEAIATSPPVTRQAS